MWKPPGLCAGCGGVKIWLSPFSASVIGLETDSAVLEAMLGLQVTSVAGVIGRESFCTYFDEGLLAERRWKINLARLSINPDLFTSGMRSAG